MAAARRLARTGLRDSRAKPVDCHRRHSIAVLRHVFCRSKLLRSLLDLLTTALVNFDGDRTMNNAAELPVDIRIGTETQRPARADARAGWRDFLLGLPQPVLVLGSAFAVASAYVYGWMDYGLLAIIMTMLATPLCLIAERLWPKRKDWILTPKELAEDAFWRAGGTFLWAPLYSDYFRTPISDAFKYWRDQMALHWKLDSHSVIGLVLCAILLRTLSEGIYYWLHRVQHESLFWWRMHATHHHITKMSAMRGGRTHPLEFASLVLAGPIVLALTGASGGVIAVSAAFGFWNGALNHANLPLKSNKLYALLFATTEQHHLHHSREIAQSNNNYGCNIILWDRIFGTYSDATDIKAVGAGTGKALPIWEQFKMAFVSSKKLTRY
ncbi:MAG: sterol desaturase family protein [Solimonas sp.]